jgi:hypothetical protein
MAGMNDFKHELRAQIERAEKQGRPHVEVNTGELHRVVGVYPDPSHQMPTCCAAMRQEQQPGDEVIFEPAGGAGASLTIRYKLPRQ